MTEKIPCYIIGFFMFDFFKRTMECLLKESDRLDIKVIENHSKYTDSLFKPYVFDLIKKCKVSEYFLFDENISNNAPKEIIFKRDFSKVGAPFIIITDGDIVLPDGWLDEEIGILQKNKNVFAVGVDLCMQNLPKVEGAKEWVPKAKRQLFKNYSLGDTGAWSLMFRTKQFAEMVMYLGENGQFVDSTFHQYCKKNNMDWVRTKHAKAYHLTWDLDADPAHEYHEFRGKTITEKWSHAKFCGYSTFTKNGIENVEN